MKTVPPSQDKSIFSVKDLFDGHDSSTSDSSDGEISEGEAEKIRETFWPECSSNGDGEDGNINDITPLFQVLDPAKRVPLTSFTIKQLIRKLHITRPAHAVMCILGKK